MATQYVDPITFSAPATVASPAVEVVELSDFSLQLEDDLENVFYNVAEYAEVVTYRYRSGASQSLVAIFDEEASVMDLDIEAPVLATAPQFHASTHKFDAKPDRGDSVVIRGREFAVKEVLPNGVGVTVVTLLRD